MNAGAGFGVKFEGGAERPARRGAAQRRGPPALFSIIAVISAGIFLRSSGRHGPNVDDATALGHLGGDGIAIAIARATAGIGAGAAPRSGPVLLLRLLLRLIARAIRSGHVLPESHHAGMVSGRGGGRRARHRHGIGSLATAASSGRMRRRRGRRRVEAAADHLFVARLLLATCRLEVLVSSGGSGRCSTGRARYRIPALSFMLVLRFAVRSLLFDLLWRRFTYVLYVRSHPRLSGPIRIFSGPAWNKSPSAARRDAG